MLNKDLQVLVLQLDTHVRQDVTFGRPMSCELKMAAYGYSEYRRNASPSAQW